MKNITMAPVMSTTDWQLALSGASAEHATSALACAAQGIAVRPTAPNAAFGPFAAAVALDGTAATALKRERAIAGKGHRAITATVVPGSPAWSPPI